jgi:hypothetical protein
VDEQLIGRVTQAIQNPGHIIDRAGDLELKERWAARAVLDLLHRGLLIDPKPPTATGLLMLGGLLFVIGLAIGGVFL